MKKVCAAAVAMMFAARAGAAPPDGVDPGSPLAQWYRSLRTPDTGVSCCSVADCRPVQARQVEDHWEVLTEEAGRWYQRSACCSNEIWMGALSPAKFWEEFDVLCHLQVPEGKSGGIDVT